MIEDLAVRGFTPKTHYDYFKIVRECVVFIGRSPYSTAAEDLRLCQIARRNDGLAGPPMTSRIAELRFFFTTTLDRFELSWQLIRTDLRREDVQPTALSAFTASDEHAEPKRIAILIAAVSADVDRLMRLN